MYCIFDPKTINPQLPGVILLSHGRMAAGMLDTAEMILGDQENVAAFCLEPGDDLSAYRSAFSEAIRLYPDGIVLVDIWGGTPCNQLLQCSREMRVGFQAVTGANMPLLLDVLSSRPGGSGSSAEDTIAEAVDGIKDLSSFFKSKG